MLPPFRNEPFTNFNDPANKAAFEAALKVVESRFGEKIPLIVNGERIFTDDTIKSTNPAQPDQVLAYVSKGTKELALRAIEGANKTFQTWKNFDPDARGRILIRAAAIMRRRKRSGSGCEWVFFRRMIRLSSGAAAASSGLSPTPADTGADSAAAGLGERGGEGGEGGGDGPARRPPGAGRMMVRSPSSPSAANGSSMVTVRYSLTL